MASESHGWFTDVTASRGLPVQMETWPDGHFLAPEITAGGIALFDYDNDGDLDIYQVRHPAPGPWEESFATPAPNRLFRQRGDGTFADVSRESGLAEPGYGHGVAVGDIDNDGDLDVYVVNLGRDKLFSNRGDGTFADITAQAGIKDESQWSSSCGFFDYDRDGDLDLFVVRFARFEPDRKCADAAGKPEYCNPQSFYCQADALYRNRGNGTFAEVTKEAGIDDQSRGWGVVFVDADDDGWPDIFVANDGQANQLWMNRRDGTFVEQAATRGVALNGAGVAEANMGVAVGDIANRGRFDLFITHLRGEKNTLFAGNGPGMFHDRSATMNLAVDSIPYTGWGCGFADFDHDGDLDLAVVNGRVARGMPSPGAMLGAYWNQYAEPSLVFENDGTGVFRNGSSRAGDFTREPRVSHALAFGDLDNDGDLDLVSDATDNSLRIYRNDAPVAGANWLIVRPMVGRRDAYGAIVTVSTGRRKFHRIAHPTYSYLASNDPRAHFGLGNEHRAVAIEVRWPDGRRERFSGGAVNRVITVNQGTGEAVETTGAISGDNVQPIEKPSERSVGGGPSTHLAQGDAFRDQGDLTAAMAHYDAAIRTGPPSSAAYSRRADLFVRMRQFGRAAADYDRAIEFSPDDATLRLSRALVAQRQGDYDAAMRGANEAIRLDPQAYGGYSFRSNLYIARGEFERALADADEAIRCNKDAYAAHHNRGLALAGLKRLEEAIASYATAIMLNKDFADAYINRGTALWQQGQVAPALADFEEAIRIAPDSILAHENRGILRARQGDPAGAIADFSFVLSELEKGVRQAPTDTKLSARLANVLLKRAAVFVQTKRYARAIEDTSEALRILPNFRQALVLRSEAYRASGDTSKADADRKRAAALPQ